MSIERKRSSFVFALLISPCLFLIPFFSAAQPEGMTGKDLFQRHCAACHPNGGNIINPLQTLQSKDLEANGFTTPQDIVNKMRNPEAFSPHMNKWSAMKKFDEKTLPDQDAFKIAEYVLKAFQ